MASVFAVPERLYPAFDRRALPTYVALAIGAALTVAFVSFGGFRFVGGGLMIVPPTWAAFLIVCGLLARRYGHPQLALGCESVGLIYSQGLMIEASLPMITAFSLPLADNLLARCDQLLGFDWVGYVMLFRDSHLALHIVSVLYMSFVWEAVAILVALAATGQNDRAWRFVNSGAIALLITVAIFPLFPAVGGFVHYGITRAAYPNLDTTTPWTFAPAILSMKGGTKLITAKLMVGYVSFPSYHAASAVLFSWAAWSFRRGRWFFLAINIGMAASAIIIGAHYLTDLIGGALVAALSIWIAREVIAATERSCSPSTLPMYWS